MKITYNKIDKNYPFELLLLADETVEAIGKYLYDSDVYVARNGEEMIGVFCLFREDARTIEIKNIAVSPDWQNRGVGSHLLNEIQEIARNKDYKNVIVGTGDCGYRQIRFYERNGFVKYGVRQNFFVDNFAAPIYENGVMLRDMVMLRREVRDGQGALTEKATPDDYPAIMAVWESSVKATHDFLKPEDFDYYKKIIPTAYLPVLEVYVLRIENNIVGFIGVSGENLEMLFVAGNDRGKGYGKILLAYAVQKLNIKKVDVNEQNIQALQFYEKQGFKVEGRSEKDSTNKDYPVLHLCRR